MDERGLDKVDRAILGALCQQFGGGPVGLSTLAISVSEQTETVEDVYEPFLIQQGLLVRTPRGRVALPAAWDHLGLAPPATSRPSGRPASADLRRHPPLRFGWLLLVPLGNALRRRCGRSAVHWPDAPGAAVS